jgi:myosin heavy subunit
MEPLVFKIETQADDSGVRNYDKSLGGLDVSSKKASGALKSFSRELINAKSGADVAAAGAESLSRILEKSLAGVVVIGGIKIVTDQINKMSEILRTVGESTSAAVTQLERMGEIKGIDDAIRGVGAVNQSLDTTIQKLGSIQEGNWFTKFIASTTGTTEELKKQQETLEKLRDSLLAYGFAAEKDNAEKMSQLNDEQKQYEEIQQKLKKRLEIIDQIKSADDRASATRDANALAGIETQNLTNKLMEEQGKKEEELHQKRIKELEERAQKERELAETQQKRFNDLYDAEIKAQEATQKRIDANNKAEQDLADKRQSLEQDVETAKAQYKYQAGGVAQETAANMSGGSASRGAGQRETSFEAGLRRNIARAEQRGRTAAADAQMQRKIDEIKQERAAVGDTRFTGKTDAMNRMADEAVKAAESNSRASLGTDQMAQNVADASKALSDFQQASQSSSATEKSFSSNLSELGTGFDEAMNNANNFSQSMTKNGGNMVDNFLKAGSQSSDLGNEFDKTAEAAKSFGKELQKRQAGEAGTSAGRGKDGQGAGSLSSIEKLLQKNFDELKAYAHAT